MSQEIREKAVYTKKFIKESKPNSHVSNQGNEIYIAAYFLGIFSPVIIGVFFGAGEI